MFCNTYQSSCAKDSEDGNTQINKYTYILASVEFPAKTADSYHSSWPQTKIYQHIFACISKCKMEICAHYMQHPHCQEAQVSVPVLNGYLIHNIKSMCILNIKTKSYSVALAINLPCLYNCILVFHNTNPVSVSQISDFPLPYYL